MIEQQHFVSSATLCELLNASESTIRRDLEDMESNGLIDRVHGGAVRSKHLLQEPIYQTSLDSNFEEKVAIANAVVQLIEPHDVIFLNHGTTNEIIAQSIAQNSSLHNVTVITSNMNAAQVLKTSDVQLIVLGGVFRKQSHSFIGQLTIDGLKNFHANKSFLGVDGIHIRYGCSFSAESDAIVSKQMIAQTHGKTFIVADHTKWGVVAPYFCSNLKAINTFVTGKELDTEIAKFYKEHGVSLIRTP